jgi:myo-inositol 2-dehydrogenase/D-chiro-inositol 1-dehydrogenase
MTRSIGMAVIGCGDVAVSRHLPAIAADPQTHLVSCCDADIARAETAAARFGARSATTSVDLVLTDPDVHAVVIATPPWVTPGLTVAALRAGKDVLAEKPIALTLDEAMAVRAAVQATDRFVQVGFVMRHGPIFGSLHEWITEDRLGFPLDFRISIFDERWDPVGDPEHYARIMATLDHGAPCIHDGAHTMDHLHFLTDDRATSLVSWGVTTRPEFPRPNLNGAVIEFAQGHRARVEIGWFLPDFPPSEWSIVGPEGRAWFDFPGRCVHLRAESGDEDRCIEEDWFENCFRHQLATFVQGVQTRTPPASGIEAAIASLVLTQAFERGLADPLARREVTYP